MAKPSPLDLQTKMAGIRAVEAWLAWLNGSSPAARWQAHRQVLQTKRALKGLKLHQGLEVRMASTKPDPTPERFRATYRALKVISGR